MGDRRGAGPLQGLEEPDGKDWKNLTELYLNNRPVSMKRESGPNGTAADLMEPYRGQGMRLVRRARSEADESMPHSDLWRMDWPKIRALLKTKLR